MQAELTQHESSVVLPDGACVHPACPPDEQEGCIKQHESPRALHEDAATSEVTDVKRGNEARVRHVFGGMCGYPI